MIKLFDITLPTVTFTRLPSNFKTAVLRNKARRRGRAAFQAVIKRLDIKETQHNKSFLVVFLLKPLVLNSQHFSLQEDIQQSLSKSGIMQTL